MPRRSNSSLHSRRLTAAAILACTIACNPKTENKPIASPDSQAADPGASDGASSRDLASVCAEATPVAAASPGPASYGEQGDASLTVFGAMRPKEGSYSLADLQALEKKGQDVELLEHLEDVPPAGRSATWDALLARTATKVVAGLDGEGDTYRAFEAMMIAEGLLQRYPQLAETKDFMAKRSTAGEHMFAKCFELTYSGEECVAMALAFVRVAGTDPKTSLAVAKIVRRNQFPYVAVPFFRAALDGKDHSACADDDLALATTAGLGLPPDEVAAKTSRDIAQNVCFSELEKPIVAALTGADGGGYFRDNACAVLRAKGVLK